MDHYDGMWQNAAGETIVIDAEEHLHAARRLYNVSVTACNTAIAVFPEKLLAGSRQPKEFFAADAGKREDVKMTF